MQFPINSYLSFWYSYYYNNNISHTTICGHALFISDCFSNHNQKRHSQQHHSVHFKLRHSCHKQHFKTNINISFKIFYFVTITYFIPSIYYSIPFISYSWLDWIQLQNNLNCIFCNFTSIKLLFLIFKFYDGSLWSLYFVVFLTVIKIIVSICFLWPVWFICIDCGLLISN